MTKQPVIGNLSDTGATAAGLENLSPDYFGMVVATGIVSLAL